jgi:beta-lactamase class A
MNEHLKSPPSQFGGSSNPSADSVRRLENALDQFVSGEGSRSIAVETMVGPVWRSGRNQAISHPAASLIKVPLVLTVHSLARSNRLSMETPVHVGDLPPTSFPSVFEVLDESRMLSLREICGLTLATSDNRGASYLLDLVGTTAVNRLLQDIGCSSTLLQTGFADHELGTTGRANVSTAADMLHLMNHIYRVSDCAEDVLRAMQCVPRYSRMSLRIPDEVVVARKSGSLFGVVNDTGIIHDDRVVMAVAVLCDDQGDPSLTAIQIGDCVGCLWEELCRKPAL